MAKGSLKEVEVKHSGTPDLVPFEINLEEALLFGGGEDGEVVEFTLTLQTAEGGQIDRTWRLRANPEYGWPDTFDKRIRIHSRHGKKILRGEAASSSFMARLMSQRVASGPWSM